MRTPFLSLSRCCSVGCSTSPTLSNRMDSSMVTASTASTTSTVSEPKAKTSDPTAETTATTPEKSGQEKSKGDLQTVAAHLDEIPSEYVKLVSNDGHEFMIKRGQAITSPTIKAMLEGAELFEEWERNIVRFRWIPSHVLHVVCKYFGYKARYTSCTTEIPEFPVAVELAMETLMAANFLHC